MQDEEPVLTHDEAVEKSNGSVSNCTESEFNINIILFWWSLPINLLFKSGVDKFRLELILSL